MTGRRWRPALALVAGAMVAASLAGCGAASTVHAPTFVVPSTSAMGNAGPKGSPDEAGRGLRTMLVRLDAPKANADALRRTCHGDDGCRALVHRAGELPRGSLKYGSHWTIMMAEPMKPDPEHPDSWLQYIRPVWTATNLPYGSHDGWTTRTMLRCRMKLVGGVGPAEQWRMWLRPMPASQIRVEPTALQHPVIGELGG